MTESQGKTRRHPHSSFNLDFFLSPSNFFCRLLHVILGKSQYFGVINILIFHLFLASFFSWAVKERGGGFLEKQKQNKKEYTAATWKKVKGEGEKRALYFFSRSTTTTSRRKDKDGLTWAHRIRHRRLLLRSALQEARCLFLQVGEYPLSILLFFGSSARPPLRHTYALYFPRPLRPTFVH